MLIKLQLHSHRLKINSKSGLKKAEQAEADSKAAIAAAEAKAAAKKAKLAAQAEANR